MTGAAILSADQMRRAEQALFDTGVSDYDLMERAGAAAAEIIWRAGHRRETLLMCGPGNNGGDGFVIARLLQERRVPVRVAALGESRTEASRRARAAWNGPVEDVMEAAPAAQIVDALFGIGLTRPLDPTLAAQLERLCAASGRSYAIDVPSGVDADSGALLGLSARFDICIALGARKPAHVLLPAVSQCGRVIFADIGIASEGLVSLLERPVIAMPSADAHKYRRGLVQVIGGAMPGAAALAAEAAARSGAGMVRLAASEPMARGGVPHAIIQQAEPPLDDSRIKALLIGPGLGRDAAARGLLDQALKAGHPLILDADALTLLAGAVDTIPAGAILTPHAGEFDRLFGPLPGNKIDRALAAARTTGAVVIYKGADSVIAAPDGRAAVAGGLSPWLSTAGTGDVLAGIAAARLAATGDPYRAACEAVWLHGDAARRAGTAFIADDLLATLPAAIAARL